MTAEPDTSTPLAARDHARAMAGTVVDTMPTMPPTAAADLPPGVAADAVLWDEVVAGGGYTTVVVPRGGRLRLIDRDGDGCAGVVLHRWGRSGERLNVADTVKVQWQAYPTAGSLLLSGLGRVLATVERDTSGRIDAFTGTTNRAANEARYGDGAPDGPSPCGRDLFAVALAKHGLGRRDVAPNVNVFKGVRVTDDGTLEWWPGDGSPTELVLRAELDVVVSIVNVPHPLDDRADYTVTPIRVTAWRGRPTAMDDPLRTATPEALRAFLNSEAEAAVDAALRGER